MVDYNRGEDIAPKEILSNATKNGIIGSLAGWFGGEGAQYRSINSTTVTSMLFDGKKVFGSSGTVKRVFYGSYKNMLNNNFKVGAFKAAIATAGITAKNVLTNQNEEECSQKEGNV